ncbi:MAG: hypothetical protein ACI4TK_12305 [Agathobacter sp.]
MKKSFTKKQTRRVFEVLLILLMVSLFTTGCGQKSEMEKGFNYTWTPDRIMFGAKSGTDTFSKNDVTFDLYYGVHDIGYDEKYNNDPKIHYQKEGNETIFFGLYICDADYSLDVMNDMEISDYKMIDNHYFVKEISEEEAFSDEYGLTMSYWKGITYNHNEKITIPSEFFVNETGSFVVKLIAFHKPMTEGGNYYTSTMNYIEFDYQVVDDNTIKIKF